jgi:hypothetical protein
MTHTAHQHRPTDAPARQLAAPAPDTDADHDPAIDDTGESPADEVRQAHLDEIAQQWCQWLRTRDLYIPPSLPPSLLGRLRSRGTGRGKPGGGPNADNSPLLQAWHLAYLQQPEEALDRVAFSAHYLSRGADVTMLAASIGVSRRHWYRLVASCRQRIHAAALQILADNLSAADRLPSRVQARQLEAASPAPFTPTPTPETAA